MIKEYYKNFMSVNDFELYNFKNTTFSQGSIGSLFFDRYLKDNGWIVKGIRNRYHPDSIFFNPKTKQALHIGYGVSYNNKFRDFYINAGCIFYEVPQNEDDIKLFESGYLKVMFPELYENTI